VAYANFSCNKNLLNITKRREGTKDYKKNKIVTDSLPKANRGHKSLLSSCLMMLLQGEVQDVERRLDRCLIVTCLLEIVNEQRNC
jgi:hypothetical protein